MSRVLIVAYTDYFHDGRVKHHAESLVERGDQVDVICLKTQHGGQSGGVNVIGLAMPRYRGASNRGYLWSYVRFFALASAAARRLGKRRRYDVVIVCTMPDAAVLCALGPKLLGSKVILDIHDTMPELYRDKFTGLKGEVGARLLMAQERASAWLADLVLAVHEPHRLRLEQAGIPSHKIRVVMNLPDPRIFVARGNGPASDQGDGPGAIGPMSDGSMPDEAVVNGHASHGPRGHELFTLACHGTVARRVGVDVIIRAMALLRERVPAARLLLIGAGDYLEEAKRLSAELKLDGKIIFEPMVPLERLPQMLADASLGVAPHRASSATHLMLPVKLLEYATLGIPAVAARLRTIEYYFSDEAVKFFEPDNPGQLADAIEYLYRNPERRAELARKARQVADRLSWYRQREIYYEAIDSLLKGKALAPGIGMTRPRENRQLSIGGEDGF